MATGGSGLNIGQLKLRHSDEQVNWKIYDVQEKRSRD